MANSTMADVTVKSGWTEENPYIISDHGIVWAEFKLPKDNTKPDIPSDTTKPTPRFNGAKKSHTMNTQGTLLE